MSLRLSLQLPAVAEASPAAVLCWDAVHVYRHNARSMRNTQHQLTNTILALNVRSKDAAR